LAQAIHSRKPEIMGWMALELGMRGAAAGLFLLLSAMFARGWRQSLTARLGTLLTMGGACYVALIAIDGAVGPLNGWRFPLHLMSLASPPLFWLFAASWFDDEFELRWWHWAFVIGTATLGFLANYLFWVKGARFFGLGLVWRAAGLIAVVLALRAALKGRDADLVESRRRMRLVIVVVVALFILWIVFAELAVRQWPPPIEWRIANAAGMLVLAVTVALSILGWRDPVLVEAPTKALPAIASRPETDDTALLARLDADMRHERLYRQDGLTIAAVATRMGVPEYRLRRAINQGLGARNFNAYLNGFRLQETADALADPTQRSVPVLTIALDAGFGSLAPFNRAFRETYGCTPTDYRAKSPDA
jgi:AraC-like DNA-binding protein